MPNGAISLALMTAITVIFYFSDSFVLSQEPQIINLVDLRAFYSNDEGGVLEGKVEATGLEQAWEYWLALIGKEGYDGNDLLKKFGKHRYFAGGRWHEEGFYNFQKIRTDSKGHLGTSFRTVNLSQGTYNVKFVIKGYVSKNPNSGIVTEYPSRIEFTIKCSMWWYVQRVIFIISGIATAIAILKVIIKKRRDLRKFGKVSRTRVSHIFHRFLLSKMKSNNQRKGGNSNEI